MDTGKCSECGKELVAGEKVRCVYCELNHTNVAGGGGDRGAPSEADTNCGVCDTFITRDIASLCCELCKRLYHNSCNEIPLVEQYCSLVHEAPKNVKWFCDKCVWETEKWIKEYTFNDDKTDKQGAVYSEKSDLKRTKGKRKGTNKRVKVSLELNKNQTIRTRRKSTTKNNTKKTKKTKKDISEKEINDPCENDNEQSNKPSGGDDIIEKSCEDNRDNAKDNISDGVTIKQEGINYDSTSEADNTEFQAEESNSDSDSFSKDEDSGEHSLIKNGKKYSKSKSNKNIFQCDKCPKYFRDKERIEPHKLWHDGDKKPFKCPVCKKGFVTKRKCNYHTIMHSDEKPHVCNICGKSVKRKDLLKGHIERVHSTKEKIHSCPECDFKCSHKQSFQKHMRTHKVPELIKCSLCDYQTRLQCKLNAHMVAHSDERSFICDECGKQYKTAGILRTHKKIHSAEKPFKCEVCEKGFKVKASLQTHMYVHTKAINHFCHICGYGAPTKDRVAFHVKTVHSDEKPFACEICGNKFKTKNDVNRHQKGLRGKCHGSNTHKQEKLPATKFKSSSESNAGDSNSSNSIPFRQHNQELPPLLLYTGGSNESLAPVYSSSHITATIHCPPPRLSVISGHYVD
ncbi:unnamed protein product [Meganyctiphanes norvegica]|uniref:Uncharacterized protein n=1 Tax=Meganyctiphanes norvegica TaxID=48144 RepID=A0AAV2SSJ9_MEGNR